MHLKWLVLITWTYPISYSPITKVNPLKKKNNIAESDWGEKLQEAQEQSKCVFFKTKGIQNPGISDENEIWGYRMARSNTIQHNKIFFSSALYLPFSNKIIFVKLVIGIMISVNNVLKTFRLRRYTRYAYLLEIFCDS